MAGKSQVKIEVLADGKKAQQVFDVLEKGAGKLGGVFDKIGGAIGGIGKVAGGVLVAQGLSKVPGLLSDAAKQAVSLEQNAKKAQVVFEDSLPIVQKWAQENAAGMGLSAKGATTLAANMADLLKPMGFTADQAAKMSTDTIGLAGALAEWSGGTKTAAEVSDLLTDAMLGETDGLKALGISLSADEIAKRASENAAKGLTFETEEQAKAIATQQLIVEKSTDAQKAYANGAESAARKQAENTAKMAEAKEMLATALLPIVTQGTLLFATLATILATKVMPSVVGLIGFLGTFGSYLQAVVTDGDYLNDFLADMPSSIQPIIEAFGRFVAFLIGTGLPAVRDFATQAQAFITGTLIPAFQQIATAVLPILQQFIGFLSSNLGTVAPLIGVIVAAFATFSVVVPIVAGVAGAIAGVVAVVTTVIGVLSAGGGLVAAIAAIAPAAAGSTTALGAIIAVLGGPVTVAIVALTVLVAGFFLAWQTNFLGIRDIVASVWAAVQPVLESLRERLDAFVTQILPELQAAWENIQTAISAAASIIQTVVTAAFDAISGFLQAHSAQIQAIIDAAWSYIQGTIDNYLSIISNLIQLVLNLIQGDWSGAWENVKAIASAVWDQIKLVIETALTVIQNLFPIALDAIKALWSAGWSALQQAVTAAWPGVQSAVESGISAVRGAFTGAASWLLQAGRDIVAGLIQGLRDSIPGLNAAADVIAGIVSKAVELKNKITSPSKVMRALGRFIGKGYALGIWDSVPEVATAGEGLAAAIADGFESTAPTAGDAASKLAKYIHDKFVVTWKDEWESSIDEVGSDMAKAVSGMFPATPAPVPAAAASSGGGAGPMSGSSMVKPGQTIYGTDVYGKDIIGTAKPRSSGGGGTTVYGNVNVTVQQPTDIAETMRKVVPA